MLKRTMQKSPTKQRRMDIGLQYLSQTHWNCT